MPTKIAKSVTSADAQHDRLKSSRENARSSSVSEGISGLVQQAFAPSGDIQPEALLALQQTAGNQAVTRLLASQRIQPKLIVGAANDAYEQEADRVAEQVMRMPAPGAKLTVQRLPLKENEPQASAIDQGQSFEPGAGFESRLDAMRGSGMPLPRTTLEFMEHRFGADFSGVRLHAGDEAAQLNRQINAQAFTRGQDIYLSEWKENGNLDEDKHLLAHELTHVMQQNGGMVHWNQGADSLITSITPSWQSFRNTAIQRKGETPLKQQAANEITDAEILALIERYDDFSDNRPSAQLEFLRGILASVNDLTTPPKRQPQIEKVKILLNKEINIVQRQVDRLVRFTATDESPYEQMTEEGMLWSHPEYEYNTEKLGLSGKKYFEALSKKNIDEMASQGLKFSDDQKGSSDDWFLFFMEKVKNLLLKSVVNSYTTMDRALSMLNGGGMKSFTMLQKDLPSFRGKSQPYDIHGLANTGFAFFFIEKENAPWRETRYSEDGPQEHGSVRISIPIQESGLLTKGWIMLTDFAQREYPDIMTDASSNAYKTWLPTRTVEGNKSFTERVRHYEPVDMDVTPEVSYRLRPPKEMARLGETQSGKEKLDAYNYATAQAISGKTSKQIYKGPDGKEVKVHEGIHNNLLVGPDIIPGLALRAALEVARISAVNPDLGKKLQNLDGDDLMKLVLKDFFRVQAMIPNSIKIKKEWIEAKERVKERELQEA